MNRRKYLQKSKKINLEINISKNHSSYGTKYKQEYILGISDFFSNVKSLKNNEGVRMEDYSKVVDLTDKCTLIMVADGHGSLKMYDGYYCGGYECAKMAVDFSDIIFKRRFKKIISTSDLEKQAKIISNVYKKVQSDIMEEMLMNGVYIIPAKNKVQEIISFCERSRNVDFVIDYLISLGLGIIYNIDDITRLSYTLLNRVWSGDDVEQDLELLLKDKYIPINQHDDIWKTWSTETSMFDGIYFQYFADTYAPYQANNDTFIHKKGLIIEKNIHGYPYHVPIYLNKKCEKVTDVDSGTTLTTCLIYQDDNDKYYMITAHVGDSHVLVLRNNDNNELDCFYITDDHGVNNLKEVKRCNEQGLVAESPYFYQKSGGTRGLMPSRSLGHPILSNYGIDFAPFVSKLELQKDDIIIISTDGLWDLNINISSILRNNYNLFSNLSPDAIASSLLEIFQNQSITDNVSFYVIKVEQV